MNGFATVMTGREKGWSLLGNMSDDKSGKGREALDYGSSSNAERRKHVRVEKNFSVVLCDRQGEELVRGSTDNISNGGCLIAAENDVDGQLDSQAAAEYCVEFNIPRQTRNTFLLEKVKADVRLVRRQFGGDRVGKITESEANLAVQFVEAQELHLI